MNEDRTQIMNWCVMNVLPGDTFIDIGADIGEMTEAVLNLHRAKRIVAIDPEVRTLQGKFEGQPVEIVESLVADRDGHMVMFRNAENTALNSIYKRKDLDTVGVVKKVAKLDSIVTQLGLEAPLVLKIDAEFAEPLIWRGMQETLPKIRVMCMEFMLEPMEKFGINGMEFLEQIKEAGWSFQFINNDNIEIFR